MTYIEQILGIKHFDDLTVRNLITITPASYTGGTMHIDPTRWINSMSKEYHKIAYQILHEAGNCMIGIKMSNRSSEDLFCAIGVVIVEHFNRGHLRIIPEYNDIMKALVNEKGR